MSASRFEVVGPPPSPAAAGAPAAGGRTALVVAGLVALALAAGATWALDWQLGRFHRSLDRRSLEQAARTFEQAIDRQRTQVASQAAVLAADTRVRAPLMTPSFDETTMRDVLDDLRKASGATMLAVLAVGGKVRAVAGTQALHDLELGSSPLVKTARERPSAEVWSFPDRALVVAVAPVRSAETTMALLAMGFEIGPPLLEGIRRTLGVEGALLIGDHVAASSTTDAVVLQAFQAAATLPEERDAVLTGDRPWVARVTRTSPSAAAGKLVWLVPLQHEAERSRVLRWMNGLPVVLVALTFLVFFSLARRGATGSQQASGRQRG